MEEKTFEELLELSAKKILNKYVNEENINQQEMQILYMFSDIYRIKNYKSLDSVLGFAGISSNFYKEIKQEV